LARAADTAVVVVATTERVESEGFDRTDLRLPGRQDDLVHAVAAANPNTVVVVNSGSPVELPWRDEVAAVLLGWFPGQEGGAALADVLTGTHEPGGRLPTTWGSLTDAPVTQVVPDDGELPYTEGVFIGYRAWEKEGRTPSYPFGHGLGYTDWTYDEIKVTGTTVTVRITNSGPRQGPRDRPDLYLAPPSRRAAPGRSYSGGTSPSGSTGPCRTGSRRPRPRRTGTARPSRTPARSTLLYDSTRSCTVSRRSVAAESRASASASIEGQMPSFQISLPIGFVRPCDQSRLRFGTLATYTCVFGSARRRDFSESSNSARKSATEVIAEVEARQASFAPTITVTNCGFGRRRLADLRGQVGHPRPGLRVVPTALGRARLPQQPYGETVDRGRLPVAQDTSGQSDRTEQASKPRVMESPTAASEDGLLSHSGRGGGGLRLAAVPLLLWRRGVPSAGVAAGGTQDGRRHDGEHGP
jgi:hypothetical protein